MATGIVSASLGNFRYTVVPEFAVADTLEGVSILKTALTVGQTVRIVQVGNDGDERGDEYGFAAEDANIRGVLNVTDGIKPALIEQNPASFGCAYIAAMAGNIARYYNIGRVVTVGVATLTLLMLTGNAAGQSVTLDTVGVVASDFFVDEIALVDERTYGASAVVGWWDSVCEFINLTEYPGPGIEAPLIVSGAPDEQYNRVYRYREDVSTFFVHYTDDPRLFLYPAQVEGVWGWYIGPTYNVENPAESTLVSIARGPLPDPRLVPRKCWSISSIEVSEYEW
jgi:hypothetical protein